jgi:hypothetical protein
MPDPVDVKHIVRDYLVEHKYDGLARENCGCGLNDFMCCLPDMDITGCCPAHKRQANQADIDHEIECEIGDWIYVADDDDPNNANPTLRP